MFLKRFPYQEEAGGEAAGGGAAGAGAGEAGATTGASGESAAGTGGEAGGRKSAAEGLDGLLSDLGTGGKGGAGEAENGQHKQEGAAKGGESTAPGEVHTPATPYLNKYKTDQELLKAYIEQQTQNLALNEQIGGFSGKPEGGYEIHVPEGLEVEVDKESAFFESITGAMAKANVSQELFDELSAAYYQAAAADRLEARAAELEGIKELATELKLAPAQMLEDLSGFYASRLSADQFSAMKRVLQTADAVRLFQGLRPYFEGHRLSRGDEAVGGPMNEEQILELMAGEKYQAGDPATVAKVEKAWQALNPEDEPEE